MKNIAIVALAVAALSGSELQAQVSAGNTNRACSIGSVDLTNVAVTACSGFWSGNLLKTGTGNFASAEELAALAAIGLVGPVQVVQKIDAVANNTPANFTAPLYGVTYVGFHFGGGADVFKDGTPDYNGNGGGTAFYKLNLSTSGTGVDLINFAAGLSKSSSGATLYRTEQCGSECGGGGIVNVVPEPSTYVLMATGLLGLGIVARRRRKV